MGGMGGGMGGATPGWMAMAVPLMLILGVMRALYAAAQRKGRSAGFAAAVAVFVGTWISALALWSTNYVLTLPGHDALRVSSYGVYLLGDLAVLALIWAVLAWGLVRLARARGRDAA